LGSDYVNRTATANGEALIQLELALALSPRAWMMDDIVGRLTQRKLAADERRGTQMRIFG